MQIQSVFVQTETAHRLNMNISLCKSTLWQQVALIEKMNTAVSRDLREQSSIDIKKIKNTFFLVLHGAKMKTKCHRIVSEDSQNLQRYVHIIN